MSSFFKPASQKEPDKTTWRVVNDSLLIGKYNGSSVENKDASVEKKKIAAFDFVIITFPSRPGTASNNDDRIQPSSQPNPETPSLAMAAIGSGGIPMSQALSNDSTMKDT